MAFEGGVGSYPEVGQGEKHETERGAKILPPEPPAEQGAEVLDGGTLEELPAAEALKDELEEAKREIADLKAQLAEATAREQEATQRIDTLMRAIERLKARNAELWNAYLRYRATLAEIYDLRNVRSGWLFGLMGRIRALLKTPEFEALLQERPVEGEGSLESAQSGSTSIRNRQENLTQ